MDMLKLLYNAHLSSWTMRLGAAAGVVVAVSNAMPQVQGVVHALWPVGDPWLIVIAMWAGRVAGLVKAIQPKK